VLNQTPAAFKVFQRYHPKIASPRVVSEYGGEIVNVRRGGGMRSTKVGFKMAKAEKTGGGKGDTRQQEEVGESSKHFPSGRYQLS